MFTYLFITKYIVSFFSCIIVPNALRDIFMPGKPLFPDDAKMYAYMSLKPPMDSFLWNGWGTWALTIVAMKVVAVWTAAAPFIALGAFSDIAFVAIAAKHREAIKKATEGEMPARWRRSWSSSASLARRASSLSCRAAAAVESELGCALN